MAIYRGLNATLYLGDVDNLNISLNNLGLNINDLNRIRGLSNFITQKEFHLLSGLEDDQEKETYSAYRSSFDIYQNINTLTDLYGLYRADAIVNNQIRASAIKYNFIQYDNTTAGFTVESADISTSRVSSWSNIDGTIFYGSNLEVNPNIGGSNYADNTQSVIGAEKITFLGNITPKRFEAEVPTNTVRLNINGTNYEFFAMKNIPISFDGFFKDVSLFHLVDGLGNTRPTTVIIDYSTDPPTEYQYELSFGGETALATPRTGRKRLDFYYRPDGILRLGIPRANIAAFPEAILPNLFDLNFTQNIFPQLPDFATYTPVLRTLNMDGNPLSLGGVSARNQVLNNLPTTLEELYINGTFTDSSTITFAHLTDLRTFEFNSFWGNGNIRRSGDTNVSPVPNANIAFYTVQSQSFTSLPYEMTQTLPSVVSINMFNNNIRGARNQANNATITITLDTPNLLYLDLSKNQCQPVNLANNDSIETINHYDNFSFATDDITNYYTGCRNLRLVNFSNSNVRGDVGAFMVDILSLTTLNLENTRLYGNFLPFANAAENLEERDPVTNALVYGTYRLVDLGFLNITKGLFNTAVDTNTNFFGNRLDPVQVSSGKELLRTRTRITPDLNDTINTVDVFYDLNSDTPLDWDNAGAGNEDNSRSFSITEASLYDNISNMDANEVGRITVAETLLKGNVFDSNSNGITVVGDPTNEYAFVSQRNQNSYYGAAAVFDGNGNYVNDLRSGGGSKYSFQGYGYSERFGESIAINSTRIIVGFPGRKRNFFNYSGGLDCFTHNGGNSRATYVPTRNGELGTKLAIDETYVWALDPSLNRIFRYFASNLSAETEFASPTNFGANRTIADFKVHNDKLYVGVIGNDDSTSGAVYVFNTRMGTNGAPERVFLPGNANNAPSEFVNKYTRYFGSLIQPISVGNSEFVIVASNNDEPTIITPTSGEFGNTEWTTAILDNNDQIVIGTPSTALRYALNGHPSGQTTEIPNGTAINVEWNNANNEPQTLTGYVLSTAFSTINDTGDIILDLDPGGNAHGFDGDFDGTITKISFQYNKWEGWGYGSTIELYDYETAQYTDSLATKSNDFSPYTDFITRDLYDVSNLVLHAANFSGAYKAGNFNVSDYVINANTDISTVVYSYPRWDERWHLTSGDAWTQFEVNENGTFSNVTQIPFTATNEDSARQDFKRANTLESQNLFNNFAVFEDKETQNSSKLFRLMPALDTFRLGDNTGIAGKLPRLDYLTAIVNFEIFKTSLSGTLDFNGLNTLRTLRLNNNLFEGDFPETNLPDLQLLYLNNNKLTGMGKPIMPNLEYLDASGNVMTGEVPEFTSATKIRDINFSNNLFTTYISGSVATCLNLRKLDLSNNQLTLQDAFRIIADLETNYNNNNRGGVNVVLLGNAGISEALINQNSVYSSKLSYLRNIAGWTVLVN